VDALLELWDRLNRLDRLAVDGVVALCLTILTQIQLSGAGPAGRAALLLTLALAFRRKAPLAVALVAALAVALQGLASNPPSVFGEYLSITLAVYTVAAETVLGPAAVGGVAVLAGIVLHDLHSRQYGSASGIASDLATPVLFWGVGRAVRVARGRAERSEQLAREAVERERRHIARELHDVVTHSLGIVLLQAQGAQRYLDGREPQVSEALATIEASGRTAMTEMRRLLGLLRDDRETLERTPQPRLSDLAQLAVQIGQAGLAVELDLQGERGELPAGVELSAYRIVQEALTNTLRHAHATQAWVSVRSTAEAVELQVDDDGHGVAAGTDTGRGLLGMRERVGFYGGTLEHGSGPEGGYRVRARLPLRGVEA
jgi:signal transduction histidine kinase